MNEKNKKTLYLPDWVIGLLDKEGVKYDGPGVVAAASINAFCKLSSQEKIRVLQEFRKSEISLAYRSSDEIATEIVDAAEVDAAKQKQIRSRRPSKSAKSAG